MRIADFVPAPYRLLASIVAVMLALVLVVFVLGRFGVSWDPFGWSAARHEQDRVGNIAGQHQGNASAEAAEATDAFTERQTGREALGRENRDEILSQPNAGADAGDAGLAGLRGLCRRPEYSGSARCLQLQRQGAPPAPR